MDIKGPIHQEYIALNNIYAPNLWAPKYIKPLLIDLKGGTKTTTKQLY